MSLPSPVLELAAEVVPDAEEHGRLAFAYAHGAVLSGFGGDDEVGLVCVWDHDEIPEGAPDMADHVTWHDFERHVRTVTTGEGWSAGHHEPLTAVAQFAYGVLLSDEDGSGTAARGTVSEFPQALCELSMKALTEDRDTVAPKVAALGDPWARAEILTEAMYRAYVTWFAASGHYFPGPRRRGEYARHFGLDGDVVRLEHEVWHAPSSADTATRYLTLVERILGDC